MIRNLFPMISSCIVLGVGLLSPLHAAQDQTQSRKLNPFTHIAYIPANANVASIRFEKARAIEVPTRIISTTDQDYCEAIAFRDPGGSLYCPYAQTANRIVAYELTYSFLGQPLASDESQERRFTFQVYFRPDELTKDVRRILFASKHEPEMTEYFTVHTDRELTQRTVIDEAQSRLCERTLADGNWAPEVRGCEDRIVYEKIVNPSEYITVTIQPTAGVLSAHR